MFDNWDGLSWEDCLDRFRSYERFLDQTKAENPLLYEKFVSDNPNSFLELNRVMVTVVENLHDDPDLPNLKRMVSHITLRLWLPDIPNLELHISPIEKDILWIGIGRFEVVAVQADKAV